MVADMGTVNCRLECEKGMIKPGSLPATNKWEKCPELRCPYNRYGIAGMKALSVIMPWPYFIMECGKDVENRTWSTNYRGTILIHCSKKPDPNYRQIFAEYAEEWLENGLSNDTIEMLIEKYCGHIVGTVKLVDCVQDSNSEWAEPGMWHWVLKNPVLFKEPIPARGSLGLWEYKEYGSREW
jgi:hypothetical protein